MGSDQVGSALFTAYLDCAYPKSYTDPQVDPTFLGAKPIPIINYQQQSREREE